MDLLIEYLSAKLPLNFLGDFDSHENEAILHFLVPNYLGEGK